MDYCTCKITPGTSAYGGSRIDSRGCEKHDTRDEIIDQLRQERDNSLRYTELLITERDTLRAEAARLREAAELAECYMRVLRHELAQNNANFEGSEDEAEINGDFAKVRSALASTPAQSLAAHDAQVKAAVLREVRNHMHYGQTWDEIANMLADEAGRFDEEAANG